MNENVHANASWKKTISFFSSVAIPCFFLFSVAFHQCFQFKLIFFLNLFFSVLSLAVSSMQKTMTSSITGGGTCSFVSLLFSFDGKVRAGFQWDGREGIMAKQGPGFDGMVGKVLWEGKGRVYGMVGKVLWESRGRVFGCFI